MHYQRLFQVGKALKTHVLTDIFRVWCAVINRAILLRHTEKSHENWDISLHTPPGVVSSQEHSQIELLLDGWAKSLNVIAPAPFPLDNFELN